MRKQDNSKKEIVVIYGELPHGIIRWLERSFNVKQVPELIPTAKLVCSMKMKIAELEAVKEAEEFLDMIKG